MVARGFQNPALGQQRRLNTFSANRKFSFSRHINDLENDAFALDQTNSHATLHSHVESGPSEDPFIDNSARESPCPAKAMTKSLVITGATRGLGLAMTRFFALKGHTIYGCGRDATTITALKKRISQPAQLQGAGCFG